MGKTYRFSQNDEGRWELDPAGEEFTVTHEAGGNVHLRNAAGDAFGVPRAYLGLADEPAAEE